MSERSDSTREVLMEIGDRARGIVEELARQSRLRAEQAASQAADAVQAASQAAGSAGWAGQDQADQAGQAGRAGPEGPAIPVDLLRRLGELRACVGQVADVLEGAVERLETVESQLGDPEAGVEEQLRLGISRCEDLLLGIEHRVLRSAGADESGAAGPQHEAGNPREPVSVLVVSSGSRRRARLCLALEGQGLRVLAATDLRSARNLADRHRADVALIDLDPENPDATDLLDRWKEGLDRGKLPRSLVLTSGRGGVGTGWTNDNDHIHEEHGEAALAARLTRMARGDCPEAAEAH